MRGQVIAVSCSGTHSFSKRNQERIRLIAGLGVEGDAHMGVTVRHRSRVAQDPTQPNLRQVHLMHTELFDELRGSGFQVEPGAMGENIATSGIDLLALPTDTRLYIGSSAVVQITGLRNPCAQIEQFQTGLLAQVVHRNEQGELVRKAGVMSIVLEGGDVAPGDPIRVELPPEPHRPLERV